MVWWCLIRERGHANDNQREQDEMLRLRAFRRDRRRSWEFCFFGIGRTWRAMSNVYMRRTGYPYANTSDMVQRGGSNRTPALLRDPCLGTGRS